jgi:predicted phosphoadenosine phosphosulfate sulfurtransferase
MPGHARTDRVKDAPVDVDAGHRQAHIWGESSKKCSSKYAEEVFHSSTPRIHQVYWIVLLPKPLTASSVLSNLFMALQIWLFPNRRSPLLITCREPT